MKLFLIIAVVAYLLFKDVKKHIEQEAEVQAPEIPDGDIMPEESIEAGEDVEGGSVFNEEVFAGNNAGGQTQDFAEEPYALVEESVAEPAEEAVKEVVTRSVPEIPAVEEHKDKEKIDPKKLIVYSEILRPKFLD